MKLATGFSLVVFALSFFPVIPVFGYQLTFQPRFSLGVEYTDNVFLDPDDSGENVDNPEVGPQDDFIFIPTPGFTAEMLGRQNGLSFSYDFGYSYYNTFSEKNSWRHGASISAWTQFNRNQRLELRDIFSYSEDPLGGTTFVVNDSPDSIDPADPTTLRSRQAHWANTANLLYTQQFGRNDSYFLQFNNNLRGDDDFRGNSSIVYTPRAGINYWFTPQWGSDLQVEYSWGNFDDAPDVSQWYTSLQLTHKLSKRLNIFGVGTYRSVKQSGELQDFLKTTRRTLEDYKVYDLRMGFNYAIGTDLTLDASAGANSAEPNITSNKTNFAGTLSMTKIFRRGSMRIYGGTGYSATYSSRSDVGPSLFYEAGISGIYQAMRYVSLNAFVSFRRDEYGEDQRVLLGEDIDPDFPEIPQNELERTDDSYGGGIGVVYKFRPWVFCTLRYAYRNFNSNQNRRDYDENRVSFSISMTTPRAFRTTR